MLSRYLEALVSLIFSPTCVICGRQASLLCDDCWRRLPEIIAPICANCGKPTSQSVPGCRECRGRRLYFRSARALWLFEGEARKVIHAMKYHNGRLLARSLGAGLAGLLPGGSHPDAVTWVPLGDRGRWERGFNQAKLLAQQTAGALGVPARHLLVRVGRTEPQSRLGPADRRRNARGAFAVRPSADVKGLDILLVDDVYTTGSTVADCSRALRQAGARHVDVVTLARTVLLS